ncbi:MAG: transglycosylase domain-containing protein, partial [Mycobacteriales bacterium]
MRTTPGLQRIALALAVCLLTGLALAGLALPVVGGLGLAAKSASDTFNDLPDQLPALALQQRSRILDADGHVLATLFTENRVQVRLDDVPVLARQALIAIEDNRFYEHRGIDVKGTLRALARNSSSGAVQQGGSTLTQQYVKNVLIESARTEAGQKAATERTAKRKLQEAKYALALEHRMTKDQILEGYLNIAYYGSGVYGIGTAANHYFGKAASQLDLAQGALLAGMVQNPNAYDPTLHPKAAVTRRNTVLARMQQLGYISDADQAAASREPLHLRVTTVHSGCEAPGVTAPFFCDYVRRYLEDGPAGAALGSTRQERQERLLAGGLTIRTTLDPKVQLAAQQAVNGKVPPTDPFGAVAVADTVEPGTGYVKAMAVDRPYGEGKG